MRFLEKLISLADKIPKVYAAGKKAEYDAFWDSYQAEITGKSCDYMFAGRMWTKEICVPKHDVISPASVYMMFSRNPFITDLREFKKANGEKVVFDFKGCTNFQYLFYLSKVTYAETIDTTSASSVNGLLQNGSVQTIELLKLKEDGTQGLANAFAAGSLRNIAIEGKIGHNNTEFTSPVLTKASLYSIINALSTTTSGYALKLKKAAVTNAFGDVDDAEWAALVATKPNWTISLS